MLAALVAFVLTASPERPTAQTQTGGPVTPATDVTPGNVIIAADRLRANRWYAPPEIETSPSMDLRILTFAVSAPVPELRRVAVRALGWMENPKDVQVIAERLSDPDKGVRLAAVNAIAQCLWNAKGDAITLARLGLEARLVVETDAVTKGAIYEALGGLRYGDRDDVRQIENTLRAPFMPSPMLSGWASALRGVEVLTRRQSGYYLDVSTLKRVRELATDGVVKMPPGPPFVDPVLTALQILSNVKDDDVNAIQRASQYHCPGKPRECGWETRLIGLEMLDTANDIYAPSVRSGLTDPVSQVRYEALTRAAQIVERTGTCGPLIDTLADRAPQVALHAIELLNPKCAEHDVLVEKLTQWVEMLNDPLNDRHWQLPVAALKTLVKFDPDLAHKIAAKTAATHKVWQVRLAGVHVASALVDEDLVLRLVGHDPDVPSGFLEANVRTEALKALRRMNSKALPDAAIDALAENDYQLLITAANFLEGTKRHDAVAPLLAALQRLTRSEPGVPDPPRDTSREARLAILARVQELGTPADYLQLTLKPYLSDVDPRVASAAADVIATAIGIRPVPTAVKRPPIEPSDYLLGSSACATMSFEDDVPPIVIKMSSADAPVTALRFLMLADSKFYDGTTFYRYEANQFALGGSPGANVYAGADRFLRDEIGLPNQYGAISMSTRGRDAGDGQFFVNLADQPQFDHEYTVFAQVISSGDAISGGTLFDQFQEGLQIRTIRTSTCPGRSIR